MREKHAKEQASQVVTAISFEIIQENSVKLSKILDEKCTAN